MLRFENSVDIHRPVSEVFSFIADFENASKWNYYVRKVTKITDGPIDVGTAYHQVRKRDQQYYRITELTPDAHVTVKTLPASSPSFEMRFDFEAVPGGTRLVDSWKLETDMPDFVEKLARSRIRKAVTDNLLRLKMLLETGSVELQDGRLVHLQAD
jgi:hypothetical protein